MLPTFSLTDIHVCFIISDGDNLFLQLTQAADLGVGHGGDGHLLQAAGLAAPRAEGPPPGHHRLNTRASNEGSLRIITVKGLLLVESAS